MTDHGHQMQPKMAGLTLQTPSRSAELREKLSLAMDGVILGIPPQDPTDRLNWCKFGDTHIYRRPSESFSSELAGRGDYGKQVPRSRALPMWGGCSAGGFSVILWHKSKKVQVEEGEQAVRSGALTKAITELSPVRARGPWKFFATTSAFLLPPFVSVSTPGQESRYGRFLLEAQI